MNYSLAESPFLASDKTKEKLDKWVEATAKGEKIDIDVYGKPTEKQLQELENIRSLSKELQDNLHELESFVRVADVENEAMNPRAPILDYSEDHEFVSENQVDEQDEAEAREEEKRKLTKGKRTEIQQFYKGQCVFLTGGTGFLGKVMLEKLLRSCGDIDTIYVLIRSKKGKDCTARLHDLLDEYLFQRAHDENPKGIHKVVPISGDMQLPGLGISDEDRKTLASRVTIIINAAATVKFDEVLCVATAINVSGTKEVIKLAKECKSLKAFTHVSTAFSNTHVDHIEEKFYEPPMSIEALEAISELDQNVVDNILPHILGDRPNTYCFTKAIAEEAVRVNGVGLPMCIVRPAIVISTYEEPYKSWTDSIYGPTGLIVGAGTGVLRTMYCSTDKVGDMVPVDLCANSILASAWFTAKNFKENQTSDIPIYNFVSSAQNPITWGKFIYANHKYGINNPTIKAAWYYGMNPTQYYPLFLFYNFFLHYLPALLADTICLVMGKPRRMLKFYHKLMKLANILFYFSMRDWRFSDYNVRNMWSSLSDVDKDVFPFSMKEMSWDAMIETFTLGLRLYIVKDDLSTLPEARKRWNRLYYMHQLLKLVTVIAAGYLGYYLVSLLFKSLV